MISKTTWGMTLMVAFAISMISFSLMSVSTANASFDWSVVTSATAIQQDDNMSKLSVTTDDDIPRKTDVSPHAVAGFAWADLDTGKVLVATIHPTFRDSNQNPDSWHLHAAQLAEGVNGHNFCIDSFLPNPQGGIAIKDNKMSINIENSQMPFETAEIDGAVGFVVELEPSCVNTGLAVDVTGDPVGIS
jgi:hypothetical protein